MPSAIKPALERAARALCRFEGHPEDTKFEGRPMWESYVPQAEAVLEALVEPASDQQLEYVPIQIYHVLRRLSQGAISTNSMHGREDEGLVQFLLSRGLAVEIDGMLHITVAGTAIGEIEDER